MVAGVGGQGIGGKFPGCQAKGSDSLRDSGTIPETRVSLLYAVLGRLKGAIASRRNNWCCMCIRLKADAYEARR